MALDTKKAQNAHHRERQSRTHTATPKHKKSPGFQGTPGQVCGRGSKIRTHGTRFWSGCGKSMSKHTAASFPHGCAVCVSKTHAPKSFDDLLMIFRILRPETRRFCNCNSKLFRRKPPLPCNSNIEIKPCQATVSASKFAPPNKEIALNR